MAWEAAQQQNATLMQMNAQALGAGTGPCKLYVGNLHPNISVRLAACMLTGNNAHVSAKVQVG